MRHHQPYLRLAAESELSLVAIYLQKLHLQPTLLGCVQLLSACSHSKLLHTLQDRMRLIDLVLEVRDARIPFSSANPELEALVRHKRRLIVLNKADLAAPDKQQVGGTAVHRIESTYTYTCVPSTPWQF